MIMEFDIFGNKLLVHAPQIFLTQKETLFKTLNSKYYVPGLRHHTLETIPCSVLHTHLGQVFLRRQGIVSLVLSVFHCRQMRALTFWKMLKAITVCP